MADFEEIALAIHENTGKYGVVGGLPNPQLVNALYLSLGEGMYNADGTALGFSDKQPLVDYFAMMVRLQDAGAMVSREEEVANPTNLENNAFVSDNAGMFFAHTNQYVALYTAAGEDRNLMIGSRTSCCGRNPIGQLPQTIYVLLLIITWAKPRSWRTLY